MENVSENPNSQLALLGGPKIISSDSPDTFTWPIITKEHEEAVLEVLRAGKMSGLDITNKFEDEYAESLGMKYALGCNNGTNGLYCAFFGLNIGVGDEVIGPSMTYWASLLPVYSLGATVVFAEVAPDTLCVDPDDIEHRITPRTKAILVVHYGGRPADMDRIMQIAKKHNLKVIEDFSHAHGALYKGKEVGTFGDANAASLMSGKSFPIGEGGMMFTNDQRVYERGLLFGHYVQHSKIELEDLKPYIGLPCGGVKYRMHQLSAAFGRVQLKLYKSQMAEIDKAMKYFCDLIEDIPGLKPVRPPKNTGTTMGGWYNACTKYDPEKFDGLSASRFVEAIVAEGSVAVAGANKPLHLHPVFTKMDIYGHGKPTRIANSPQEALGDLQQLEGALPVTESVTRTTFRGPWFKLYRPDIIEKHADVFRKVAANYKDLLPGNTGEVEVGSYSSFFKKSMSDK